MKFEQIIHDLKNKVYYPIYLLMGEEPYYIDKISDYIEDNILDENEKEFNQNIVYARDIDVDTLVSYAKSFPMISNHRVVIVKEAQNLQKIEKLQSYAEKPQKSTILVLCHKYKKLDKRKAVTKAIGKNGVVFESKKLYDNQIPQWVEQYLKSKKIGIEPKAAHIIAEYLGNDLLKIANELDKLAINTPSGKKVNLEIIEENIGISKDFNVFELQKAIGTKNTFKANQIINYFAANPKSNPMVVTITNLYSYFSKILIYHALKDKSKNNVASALSIHPFFVQEYQVASRNYPLTKTTQIISFLREYDAKFKGIGNVTASDGYLLKELLYKILH